MFFNHEKFIKEAIPLFIDKTDKDVLNIAYGTDKNFLFGCAISITSIILHNAEANFHFHIFTDFFSQPEKEKFQSLAQQYQIPITIYIVNAETLTSLPNNRLWTYAIYFRFIIADYFYNKCERVLYLDSDIICQGSIKELCFISLINNIVAAAKERESAWWQQRAMTLGEKNIANGYFNSGVLLINIPEWNRQNISNHIMTLLNKPDIIKTLTFYDQDALNIVLAGRILFLENKYNTQFSLNYELKENYKNPINEDTVLIHYIGPSKPWHHWTKYPSAQAFYYALDKSPWKSVALMKPINSTQWRYCAKHQLHKKEIFSGVVSYIKYFSSKLLS